MIEKEIARLKQFENRNRDFFNEVYLSVFKDALNETDILLEKDDILQMFLSNELEELRMYLDHITEQSKKIILEALAEGENNSFQEKRYKDIKGINDLFTYYYDVVTK